jgi:HJR/Mrr/RecB family endonuclease
MQLRRDRLVRMNWKAMRGPQLEEFLAVVFTELGYAVEMIGAAGDQGVDLVAMKDAYRFAIQSKGYVESVSNGAVQEAFAGMTYHGCQGCAVITNSRFTNSAIELARCTNCILVDEDSLPELIRGDFDLLEKQFPAGRRLAPAASAETPASGQ